MRKLLFEWLFINKKKIIQWLVSGVGLFLFCNLILYLFVDIIKVKLFISSIIVAEIGLLIRFIINQKIIFKSKNNFFVHLLKFHSASLMSFLLWIGLINYLNFIGLHYLYSSLIAIIISTSVNFLFHFFWIWNGELTFLLIICWRFFDAR